MDRRNRHPISRSQLPPPHFIEDLHRNPYDPTSRPHPVALMEERIDRQHREIQALLLDNQRFGATHVALKQEVSAAQQELRHLAATAQRVKAEREDQVQEIYERSLVLEAEARSVGAMKAELVQVREDDRKLNVEGTELSEKLRELNGELARVRAESQLALIIKEEIEIMHQELQKGSRKPSQKTLPEPPQEALMENQIDRQQREIQSLLLQRLATINASIKQEVFAAQQELRHLSAIVKRGETEAQVKEIHERSLVLEAEARSVGAELVQVREDMRKLNADKVKLSERLQEIDGELERVREELRQMPAIKQKIEIMHYELQRGRAAIEHEKKNHAENLKHRQSMEKNMVIMAREIEKLRAELANAEKRARAAAAVAAAANPGPGYAGSYGSSEMGYGGNYHADPYSMSQVHGGVDGDFPYGSRAFSHGPM